MTINRTRRCKHNYIVTTIEQYKLLLLLHFYWTNQVFGTEILLDRYRSGFTNLCNIFLQIKIIHTKLHILPSHIKWIKSIQTLFVACCKPMNRFIKIYYSSFNEYIAANCKHHSIFVFVLFNPITMDPVHSPLIALM